MDVGTRLSYSPPLSQSLLGVLTHSRSVSPSNYRPLLKTFHGKCAEAVSMCVLVCVCAYGSTTFWQKAHFKLFFFNKEAKACKNAQCQLQRGQTFLVIFLHLN